MKCYQVSVPTFRGRRIFEFRAPRVESEFTYGCERLSSLSSVRVRLWAVLTSQLRNWERSEARSHYPWTILV
ncbi:hypothetical protein F383_07603 [Gossypium arboreum]|uniref:Uncharacterized protein n=1 Tax=Gossypium arboreum TaxID=29729 RepID=A0A0B0NV86_GOSAR|nr:hypothetical protein F383_07603 [Gossypium arboreum]